MIVATTAGPTSLRTRKNQGQVFTMTGFQNFWCLWIGPNWLNGSQLGGDGLCALVTFHDWDKMFWWPFMTETKCSYQPSERWAVCDAISLSCVTKCSSFRWLETTFCSKCQSWKVTKAHKPSPPYIYRFSFTWGPAKLPDQKLSKEAKDNILKLWYPLLINITKNRHENDLFGSWPI